MNLDWVAGVVVVSAMIVAILALVALGIWDLFRQYRGESLSITASQWIAYFLARHPIAGISAGFVVGVLAGHFGWFQVVRLCK